jgi:hypothetical protein
VEIIMRMPLVRKHESVISIFRLLFCLVSNNKTVKITQDLQEGESGNCCERSFEHSSDRERSVNLAEEENESEACLRPSAGLELILRPASLKRRGGKSPSLLHLSPSMTSSSELIESPMAAEPDSNLYIRGTQK